MTIIVTSACCGSRGPIPRCPYPPQPDAVCGGGCVASEMRVLIKHIEVTVLAMVKSIDRNS